MVTNPIERNCMSEAAARIKINKLLEAAGWRFFPAGGQPANIRLESSVTIQTSDLEALGNDFEQSSRGFIDFLLLDAKGFSPHRSGGQGGGERPVGRQGAGAQVRPFAELSLRPSLERQPSLFLGSRTWQSLSHHFVPHARFGSRLSKSHAHPATPAR